MCCSLCSTIKNSLFLMVFVCNTLILQAQKNYVPNNSFEIYINCPIPSVTNKNPPPPLPWVSMQTNGFSYFNSCANNSFISPYLGVPNNFLGAYGIANYQEGHSGFAYTGFMTSNKSIGVYKRGYQEVKLTDSLKAGKKYNCGFYVALSNGCKYATNNIGMLITKTATTIDTVATPSWVIAGSPQIYNYGNPIIKDTQNWVKINCIYTAVGGEQYITIGNFKLDEATIVDTTVNPTGLNWAVYALDDVFVMPLDNSFNLKADAGKDTTITIGDSIFIGSYTNGIDSIKWQNQNTGNKIDSTRPGFWVHPLANTCYVLTQTVNNYTSSDTVCITVQPLPLKFISYSVSLPSNLGEGLGVRSIWQTANEINVSHFNIQRSLNGVAFTTIGKTVAQNKSINEYSFTDVLLPSLEGLGVGFYRIQAIDKDGKISYSETKQIRLNQLTNKPINVYPNPAKDVVNINCVGMKDIHIVNSLGQVVRQLKVNTNMLKIDISELAKGLYLLKLINNKNIMYNEKFIVL